MAILSIPFAFVSVLVLASISSVMADQKGLEESFVGGKFYLIKFSSVDGDILKIRIN